MPEQRLRPETVVVSAGRPPHVPSGPLNEPVTFASAFVAGGDLEYARYGNPSWTALEDALGALEGGECVSFASGMAAVSAVVALVEPGSAIVVPQHAYQHTLALLDGEAAAGRLEVRRVDIADADAVEAAMPGAAMVWIESPTNPALEVADIERLAASARAAGALSVVDSTFATPLLQRPLGQGADVVVHSVTKLIAGHSDVVLGAVVTDAPELAERIRHHRGMHGAIPGPMEAFLAVRGLRTLAVRLERASANARELAVRLRAAPGVVEVRDPGFGTVLALVLEDAAAADRVVERVRLWIPATSLGGVESTLERRRRWATEAPTIPEGLIRLSVGIEHIDDLAADLLGALAGARVV
ncbi:PLP-dependent aspartate aminotransferase family protein [Agrococcus sp. HG114]|uniref:trans-sulfuration enzyme family protein n=1 Tax=Agrococcus sp. HG114 TaxID=2969757 RepID=UPI00215AFC73|nr:PLP-dependent aspartate aminotransferase family protein [Agrococcus sp. HG114]MCR8671644.1 PLP-dependent aspartate aminotransferase family protein [Agrococcus sp. HG114]